MAKSKKAEKPVQPVQATSIKTTFPTGKTKAKVSTNVKIKASEKLAQKQTIVNQSQTAPAKSKATPQNLTPKKQKSPLILGKKKGTSRPAAAHKDDIAVVGAAQGGPTLSLGNLELLDLRKSIALLFMLNETPQEASENEVPAFLQQEDNGASTRALTLSQEKELAGIFAFLAAASDDPRRVAAVCLEESPNHDSLTIKIAANHGGLVATKVELEKIAQILKAVHEDKTADLQNSLFEAIVLYHQNRILCRLRSCHAKSKANFWKEKLAEPKTLLMLLQIFEQQSSDERLNSLTPGINGLANLFTKLEALEPTDAASAPGFQIILSILETAHHLCHNSDFDLLLLPRPPRLSLKKLSRYVSASADLVRAARRHSFFANVRVEIVKFEPFPNIQYMPQKDVFESLIARFSLNTTPAQLLSFLNRTTATRNLCNLINADCAVHAEIQLLFHYEFHVPPNLIPRVICSNKSACYLCNLFFSLHGRFYMPSTHGRVYEKWTLPKQVQDMRGSHLDEVIAQFSHAIIEAIRQQVGVPSKRPYYPNESAYFFRSGIWSVVTKISQHSLRRLQAGIKASHLDSVGADATTPISHPVEPSTKASNEANITLDIPQPSKSAAENTVLRSSPSKHVIETSTKAMSPLAPQPHHIEPGMSLLLELGDPSHPVRVETSHMHIDLTRDISTSGASSSNDDQRIPAPERGWAELDLLRTGEEHARTSSSGITSIDVSALTPGAHVTLDQHVVDRGLCGFYLVCGTEKLLVRCWKEKGQTDVN